MTRRRVDRRLDLQDQVVTHRQHEHREQPPVGECKQYRLPDRSGHQRGAVAQVAQQVRSHLFRAVIDLRRRGEVTEDRADAPYGRIQNGGQRLQIAVGARGDEPLGDELMFGVTDVRDPRP